MSTNSILDINYQQLKNIGLDHEKITTTYQFISCFWDFELDIEYKITAIKNFQDLCQQPDNSFIRTPRYRKIVSCGHKNQPFPNPRPTGLQALQIK